MRITIYLDRDEKVRQVIRPKHDPKCSIASIVQTVTRRNYHHFEVDRSDG